MQYTIKFIEAYWKKKNIVSLLILYMPIRMLVIKIHFFSFEHFLPYEWKTVILTKILINIFLIQNYLRIEEN